eukprot:GHVU01163784.1.p1 GENE.GHVU01163784.1~~GHVU01163784.1.p1  ORF type:complete len:279 (+),score=23.75 GHVU01163784.1:274-1110(+)
MNTLWPPTCSATMGDIDEGENERAAEATTDPKGCFSYGFSFPDNIIAWQSEVSSAPECQRACRSIDDCAYFIYQHFSGNCWLRTEFGMEERRVVADPSDGLVFGPRACSGDSDRDYVQERHKPPQSQTGEQFYTYSPRGADMPVGYAPPYSTYRMPTMYMPPMPDMSVPFDSFNAWMDSFFSSLPPAYRTPGQYAEPVRGYVRTDGYPSMEPTMMPPSHSGDTTYRTPKTGSMGQGSSGTGKKGTRTPSAGADTFSWNSMNCVKKCSDDGRSCSTQCQ